ncbi:MAG: hypothetical protein GX927_06280, partial [Lentisphaerae bacterium]|nr:hypothetical protein [Lentisphaerota bacterium]
REAAAAEAAAAANAEKSAPAESGQKRLLLTVPVPPQQEQTATATASVTVQVQPIEQAAETPPPAEQTAVKEETTPPPGEVQVAETVKTEKAEPEPVRWTGVLLSLRNQASQNASHVLCERRNYTLHPLCYVKSTLLDLRQWENHDVEISGKEVQIPGWSLPVILVNSIIKK